MSVKRLADSYLFLYASRTSTPQAWIAVIRVLSAATTSVSLDRRDDVALSSLVLVSSS
jgi:hypothetical protein